MAEHKFKIGDKVVYTNIFGVCWGVKTISQLSDMFNKPSYFHEGTETPWYAVDEEHYTLAAPEDLTASSDELQLKYGFTPTEWYGCY